MTLGDCGEFEEIGGIFHFYIYSAMVLATIHVLNIVLGEIKQVLMDQTKWKCSYIGIEDINIKI